MEFSLNEIERLVAQVLLPLFRISAFFMVAPIIGTRMVPARVRMGLAIFLTLLIVQLLPNNLVDLGFNFPTFLIVAQEVLIGVSFGFLLQIFFHLFVIAGQMIAMQMGLGFASMIDPSSGVSVAVVSQIFVILTTLIFLSLNGHLIMMEIVIDSFKVFPIGNVDFFSRGPMQLATYASTMFSGALLIALPAVTALLIVNIAFGIMTKAAPQLNIFSLGFPTAVVLGSVFLWLVVATFGESFERQLDGVFMTMRALGS